MHTRHIRGSVIIPAHNEEDAIRACLDAVMASTVLDQIDVIVVCNGCDDGTPAVARSYPRPIRCVETPNAGKHHALELGRRHTACGHRLYLDADVVVSPTALAAVLDALDDPEIHAAAPSIELEVPDEAPWPVRRFAEVWRNAPYFAQNMIGAGFYGLDAEAQRRIGAWPALIADDLVALGHVGPHERVTTPGTFSQRLAPSLRGHLRQETRREAGRIEYRRWSRRPDGVGQPLPEGGRWLWTLARSPRRWVDLGCFVFVKVAAKVAARHHLRRGQVPW